MDIVQAAPDTMIVAEDEASLYLQATTRSVWAPRGQTPQLGIDPQRDKVSFYGSLNLRTGQEIVSQETVCNGTATVRHLEKLLTAYPDVAILLLWDRATHHRCQAVRTFLQTHPRLEVWFLPPACPDLNPQEHV